MALWATLKICVSWRYSETACSQNVVREIGQDGQRGRLVTWPYLAILGSGGCMWKSYLYPTPLRFSVLMFRRSMGLSIAWLSLFCMIKISEVNINVSQHNSLKHREQNDLFTLGSKLWLLNIKLIKRTSENQYVDSYHFIFTVDVSVH